MAEVKLNLYTEVVELEAQGTGIIDDIMNATDTELLNRGEAQWPNIIGYELTPYQLAWHSLHIASSRRADLGNGALVLQKVDFLVVNRDEDGYFLVSLHDKGDDKGVSVRKYPVESSIEHLASYLSSAALNRAALSN